MWSGRSFSLSNRERDSMGAWKIPPPVNSPKETWRHFHVFAEKLPDIFLWISPLSNIAQCPSKCTLVQVDAGTLCVQHQSLTGLVTVSFHERLHITNFLRRLWLKAALKDTYSVVYLEDLRTKEWTYLHKKSVKILKTTFGRPWSRVGFALKNCKSVIQKFLIKECIATGRVAYDTGLMSWITSWAIIVLASSRTWSLLSFKRAIL